MIITTSWLIVLVIQRSSLVPLSPISIRGEGLQTRFGFRVQVWGRPYILLMSSGLVRSPDQLMAMLTRQKVSGDLTILCGMMSYSVHLRAHSLGLRGWYGTWVEFFFLEDISIYFWNFVLFCCFTNCIYTHPFRTLQCRGGLFPWWHRNLWARVGRGWLNRVSPRC